MKKHLITWISCLLALVLVCFMDINHAKADSEGTCGTNVTWKVVGDTLTVSGTGKMTSQPLGYGKESEVNKTGIKKIVVENGITEVSSRAFDYFKDLESVSLPETLTKIQNGAFAYCGLTSIEIPASVKEIESQAFYHCDKLNNVIFHEGLEKVHSWAFADCPALTKVSIPKSMITIYGKAFFSYQKGYDAGDESSKGEIVYAIYDGEYIMIGYLGSEAEKYAAWEEGDIIFQPIGGDISNCIVEVATPYYEYDGEEKTPAVKVVSEYAKAEVPGCTVTYTDNKNAGAATAIASGTGDFGGTATGKFYIGKGNECISIDSFEGSHNSIPEIQERYGCTLEEIDEIVLLSMNREAMTAREREILFALYSAGAIEGTVIEGQASSTETPPTENPSTETPDTEPTEVTKPSAPVITEAVGVAKGIKVTWEKVENAKSYIVYRNGKKAATTDKLTWTDTKAKKNGKVYQYKVVAVNSAGNSKASKVVKAAYVAPVKLTKAVNIKGKKATVQWKKNAKATGYEVKYVTGKTEKTVTIKKKATVKTTLKQLKKGKTYEISVRAYKTVKGKKYYSAWSAVKSVKIRK